MRDQPPTLPRGSCVESGKDQHDENRFVCSSTVSFLPHQPKKPEMGLLAEKVELTPPRAHMFNLHRRPWVEAWAGDLRLFCPCLFHHHQALLCFHRRQEARRQLTHPRPCRYHSHFQTHLSLELESSPSPSAPSCARPRARRSCSGCRARAWSRHADAVKTGKSMQKCLAHWLYLDFCKIFFTPSSSIMVPHTLSSGLQLDPSPVCVAGVGRAACP